jgi:hypothetical protein
MINGRMPLPDTHQAKAETTMRAFRRALMDYWYSTVEDKQAAVIAAAQACFQVNILDEAVFHDALGDPYRDRRAQDLLGRVVMGLELIRNCETHASVVFDGILDGSVAFGVPTQAGTIQRSVYTWAGYDELPPSYRNLPSGATAGQKRARKEALDGFRKAVQRRSVIETLFDAMAFFQSLDDRLVGPPGPAMPWAYGLLPDTDPDVEQPGVWFLCRPMGLDHFEPFLPHIVLRPFERRSARWPTADAEMHALRETSKKTLPQAQAREVLHTLMEDGKVLGYSGYTTESAGRRSPWVERRAQVWKDVRASYRYFTCHDGTEIDLQPNGHQGLTALDPAGQDVLAHLPPGTGAALDVEYLTMVERYPDLYLAMRRDD